jgi:hypothetical protein
VLVGCTLIAKHSGCMILEAVLCHSKEKLFQRRDGWRLGKSVCGLRVRTDWFLDPLSLPVWDQRLRGRVHLNVSYSTDPQEVV